MRTACRTHSALITGSMPGMAASTSETWLLGAPPNAVEAPENSLASELTWAWISMPTTTSQSPVAPLMKDLGSGVRDWVMVAIFGDCSKGVVQGRLASSLRNGLRRVSKGEALMVRDGCFAASSP